MPNGERSAAGHGSHATILTDIPEAHFAIRAKRLGGRLQSIVGPDLGTVRR